MRRRQDVTLNEVKGAIWSRAPFAALRVTVLSLLLAGAAAAQEPGPREVVQSAERAVLDDSVATVRARWTEALRRDSTDRVAALGLASLARLTYDSPPPSGSSPASSSAGAAW